MTGIRVPFVCCVIIIIIIFIRRKHTTKAVIENCRQDKLGNITYNCPKTDTSIKTIKHRNSYIIG